MRIKSKLFRLIRDERGTSAVEYGIICAMIVIGLVAAVKGVADENSGMWATVKSKTEAAISSH